MQKTHKGIPLGINIWFFKDKFVQKIIDKKTNVPMYYVYNKFDKHPKDFFFAASNLKMLVETIRIFEEDIPQPIVPELHPDYATVEYPIDE
jgi:hypothetical protein